MGLPVVQPIDQKRVFGARLRRYWGGFHGGQPGARLQPGG